MRQLAALLCPVALVSCVPPQGDRASQRDTSVTELKILGERGDANAQFRLGYAYDRGERVPQDYKAALKWYKLAANQGHVSAQHNLGLMYYNGEGTPKDYVQAHLWFNLAGSTGKMENAIAMREQAARLMTRDQISAAQELAAKWSVGPARKE